MPFGWSDEPLYAEQKLHNLLYTFQNMRETRELARLTRNKLAASTFDGIEFDPAHGHRAVMKWVPTLGYFGPNKETITYEGIPGYWFIYADKVGSLGDDRHKWPVWDAHQMRYEAPPKGMRTRVLPRDYLGEEFGRIRGFSYDHVLAASIEKNKWRPGPHNEMPESLLKHFQK